MTAPGSPQTAEQTRILELEDRLKDADRRLAEVRLERDEAVALVESMREQLDEDNEQIEAWKAAFELEIDDAGLWSFNGASLSERHDALVAKHVDLLMQWNRACADFNAAYAIKRPPGRPLAASDAQVAEVLALRTRGISLRAIADATSLSQRTIRTIVGRITGTDRTSIRRLERVDPMRAEMVSARVRNRSRDALPGRINATQAAIAELQRATKGLGKANVRSWT